MARKLADIRRFVESSTDSFARYLDANVDKDTLGILREIQKVSTVYIFSGVIRNYFLDIKKIRDLDIVLSGEIEIEKYFCNYQIRKNSFGGYKIEKNGISLDIWIMEKSWAFQNHPILAFEIERDMPGTAFFNFSAVVFNLNAKEFYFTVDFLRFLRDKSIDVVYKPNSNYELCIVNSFYYSDTYKLKISEHLRDHIIYLHGRNFDNYDKIQLKHFGRILYPSSVINERVENLKMEKLKPEHTIFIVYKKHIGSKSFYGFKTEFQTNDLALSIQPENEEYHNFTGPELSDVIVFVKENIFLASAVYDRFKACVIKLLKKLKVLNKDANSQKVSIRYQDDKQRNIELNIEGNYSGDEIKNIVEGAMEILATDEKEKVFNNPKYVDNSNERIEMKYNLITKKWEPFDYGKLSKEWEEIQSRISKLNG